MIELTEFWLVELMRATVVLAIAVLFAKSIFRCTQAKPQTRVLTWMLVLAPCWLLFSFALEIPCLESNHETEMTSAVIWGNPSRSLGLTPTPLIESASIVPQTGSPGSLPTFEWIAILLMAAWASGIIYLVCKYLRSHLRMQRLLSHIVKHGCAKHPLPALWLDEFEKAKREIGLRRDVQFLVGDDAGPLLCWFKGQNFVVVPETFWESSTSQQRSAILLHELAHAKRFDVWWVLIARILILPQWFNPFAWYALQQLSESIEMACDDEVLKHSKFGRIEYAKSLVSLVEFKQSDVSFGLPAIGPPVQQRIQRIVHPNGVEMKFTRMIAIGTLVLVSSFGLVRPELVAQNSESQLGSGMTAGPPQSPVAPVSKVDDGAKLTCETYYISDLIVFASDVSDGQLKSNKSTNRLGGITLHDYLPIVDLIKSTIDSESWGKDGISISPYVQNLSLVINQTPEVHDQIQELLVKLRGTTRFTIKLKSFIVLGSKANKLLPSELGKNVRSIETKSVQTIRDAARNGAIELISIPETNPINGQSVVYEGLTQDIWSVEGLSATAVIDKERSSINIKLSGMTSWPFAASRHSLLNKMVDGHVVELQRGTIIESIKSGIESEDEGRQREERQRNRVEKSIGVATVEDGKYLALDVSSMLKNDKQDRRAILIVNAKIKDNQKQEENN